jgi:GNAT superfamily N-acetyltransferase
MFAELGIVFPPGPATVETAIADGADLLVAGDPPLAFAAVIDLDGHPHLEQISVRADQARKGIGSLLLGEVIRRYGPGLTLLTFRDVLWNGPWYARHGFTEFPEPAWGPKLRGHWQAEVDAGLHDLGPRLVMHFPGG